MSKHVFEKEQFLPISLQKAWDFFSDPRNLCKITPPKLDFQIVSLVPEHITEGLKVEYRVKPLLGIPVKWLSLIQDIKAPYQFADIQIEGPYKSWHHLHAFEESNGGVLMKDKIVYEVPFESFLPWIHDAIVIKQLNEIFDYRRHILEKLF